MGGVAVGAAGYLFRKSETEILAMITLEIGADRHVGDLVPGHHLFVTMTLQADLCVKLLLATAVGVAQRLDIMQPMTVVAGGRIHHASCHPLAVNRLLVGRLTVMALDALGNDPALIFFPGGLGMDICMAVGAHDPLVDMNAGEMFSGLPFMAQLTLDLAGLEFVAHVTGKIGDINVATGASVLAVHGAGKGLDGDLVAVATEAIDRVNGHALLGKSGQSPHHHQKQQRDNRAQAGEHILFSPSV